MHDHGREKYGRYSIVGCSTLGFLKRNSDPPGFATVQPSRNRVHKARSQGPSFHETFIFEAVVTNRAHDKTEIGDGVMKNGLVLHSSFYELLFSPAVLLLRKLFSFSIFTSQIISIKALIQSCDWF